jgi:hypothetical protein
MGSNTDKCPVIDEVPSPTITWESNSPPASFINIYSASVELLALPKASVKRLPRRSRLKCETYKVELVLGLPAAVFVMGAE